MWPKGATVARRKPPDRRNSAQKTPHLLNTLNLVATIISVTMRFLSFLGPEATLFLTTGAIVYVVKAIT